MTDITAAIGLAQMKRYPELLMRRHELIDMYTKGIASEDVSYLEHYTDIYSSSGHLMLVKVLPFDEAQRNELIIKLAEAGIATNVHYKPLPMHTAYKKLGFDIKDFPNSFDMYKNEITLPLHTLLTDEQVDYVIDNFNKFRKEISVH